MELSFREREGDSPGFMSLKDLCMLKEQQGIERADNRRERAPSGNSGSGSSRSRILNNRPLFGNSEPPCLLLRVSKYCRIVCLLASFFLSCFLFFFILGFFQTVDYLLHMNMEKAIDAFRFE